MAKTIPSAAGFQPELLDPIVKGFLDELSAGTEELQKIRPVVARLAGKVLAQIEKGDAVAGHDVLLAKLERYSKVLLNLAKAGDELSRLRSFVAGGADSRPDDLRDLDDEALARIVIKAAKGLGGVAK